MTREEFLDRHRHQFAGAVMEAHARIQYGSQPCGQVMSALLAKVDAMLGRVYDDAEAGRQQAPAAKPPATANGTPPKTGPAYPGRN